MDALSFKKYITTLLKPYGFRRTGKTWGMVNDGLLTVVTIDKNPYCNGFFVYCGAKMTTESYATFPHAKEQDVWDFFIFPADPEYKPEAYKNQLHGLPKGDPGHPWIVRQYIDLSLFSDEEIDEAFRHNMTVRLRPMLDVDLLKSHVSQDDFLIKHAPNPSRLLLYGVPIETIKALNPRAI